MGGVAIQEYQIDTGPADYIVFVNRKPVELIEAKREEEGIRLTMHEDHAEGYAKAKARVLDHDTLLFVYKSTNSPFYRLPLS